jgi:type II secretory pathway pseudopilin PulG
MSFIKSFAGELLLALLTIIAVFFLGYSQGAKHNEQRWQANQAKVARAARADYDAQAKRGDAAAAQYLADNRTLQTQFNNLTEQYHALRKHTPLVGASRSCAARRAGAGSAGHQPGDTPQAGAANTVGQDGAADSATPLLTAGAVWVWNSALTGADQPTGTCSAADPTAAACAVETSLTLDDAWSNHIANAEACAANRLAHQRLIDFVTTSNLRKTAP